MTAGRASGMLVPISVAVSIFAGCGGSDSKGLEDVQLQITAPVDGSSVRDERVTVRGTVTPSDANVQIVGKPAQVGNGVFAGSVSLHVGQNTIDVVASAPDSAPAALTITIRRTARASAAAKPRASVSPPRLAGARTCGTGLVAGTRTSCPFAENVRAAFEASGSGILDVYSPTTGQTYRMYCTGGAPHVCTGGNGASVYFSSGGVTSAYNITGCGGGLAVGPNTTCAFAENVRAGYYRSGPGWISVYSPATQRTYSVYCTATSPHVCTGGNNAAVYFP